MLFEKLTDLTDEQLVEGIESLSQVSGEVALFYHEALQMEYERRHGNVYGEEE
jgi:hypothetical protein